MSKRLALAALAVAPLLAGSMDNLLPDHTLTPGAIAETSTAVICAPGYARAHRVWHDKTATLAKYGIPRDQAAQYEDDDLVAVCLGGANASPLNHWAQQRSAHLGAADKDWLEVHLHAKVCRDRNDGELHRYQAAFAQDWITLWHVERQTP
jgi:hypothetical protein